jgi:hypothetical protein
MVIRQNGYQAKWLLGEMVLGKVAVCEMVFRRNGHSLSLGEMVIRQNGH